MPTLSPAWALSTAGPVLRPAFDAGDGGLFVERRKHQFIAHAHRAALDAPGDDAAGVETVHVLDRQTQRAVGGGDGPLEFVEHPGDGRSGVPRHDGVRTRGDVDPLARRDRDEHARLDLEPGEERAVFRFDGAEHALLVIDGVHLVDHDGHLPDAQQAEQITVAAALFAHALVGGDEEQGRVGAGGPGDHVFEKLLVARRVDEHARTPGGGLERDLGNVDGDVLVALGLEGVHEKRPLEGHAAPLATGLDGVELAVRKRARVVQQPPDERGFAVVHVADDDDAQR